MEADMTRRVYIRKLALVAVVGSLIACPNTARAHEKWFYDATPGRLKTPSPVCRVSRAGPCDTWLPPFIERITQTSSIHEATSGNSSLTSMPLWPCFLNFQGERS